MTKNWRFLLIGSVFFVFSIIVIYTNMKMKNVSILYSVNIVTMFLVPVMLNQGWKFWIQKFHEINFLWYLGHHSYQDESNNAEQKEVFMWFSWTHCKIAFFKFDDIDVLLDYLFTICLHVLCKYDKGQGWEFSHLTWLLFVRCQ